VSAQKGIALCPRCDRPISTTNGRYSLHNDGTHGEVCPLSTMHAPYQSHQQSPTDYVGRAHIVANLAAGVQDEDPTVVWDYLTALPANELQRLMMLALAAIPIDQTVAEMFAWVTELPNAKTTTIPIQEEATA
jgi:hypothetical protein